MSGATYCDASARNRHKFMVSGFSGMMLYALAVLSLISNRNFISHTTELATLRKSVDDHRHNSTVHVLFALSGNQPGFLAEFEAALKSVLLNSPLDSGMRIHVMADGEAYGELRDTFNRTGLDGSVWRTQINIDTYNVEPYLANWIKQIESTLPFKIHEVTAEHTIGTFFRLFAHQVLPESVDHVLYMDTDVVIMSNLAELWDQIDRSARFQWGQDMCAGFMILNLKKAKSIWDLASQCDLSGIGAKLEQRPNDQLIFRAVNCTYPEVVGLLPPGWAISVADGAWRHGKDIVDYRPNVGMFHFNGGGASDTVYWDSDFLKTYPDTWGVATYYAKLPWPWARHMGKTVTAEAEYRRLAIRHG